MQNPTDGPYQAQSAVGVTNQLALNNNGHYISLLKTYPELFNWSKIRNLQKATGDLGAVSSNLVLATEVERDAATAYTKRHAGENAWIFAFYFPIALVVVGLGFTAFLRKSGYTLALTGVALSAVMIAFTLIIVVHYQAKSFVPQSLNAFTDCPSSTTVVAPAGSTGPVTVAGTAAIKAGRNFATGLNVQFGSLTGPVPRRAWLCQGEWDYDNDLRTAANLVYGGASVSFVGYIAILIGFAYLVQPFVTPIPTFAKNPAPAASGFRGADVDFDDYSDSSDY